MGGGEASRKGREEREAKGMAPDRYRHPVTVRFARFRSLTFASLAIFA